MVNARDLWCKGLNRALIRQKMYSQHGSLPQLLPFETGHFESPGREPPIHQQLRSRDIG
jgi:hypothetical protein